MDLENSIGLMGNIMKGTILMDKKMDMEKCIGRTVIVIKDIGLLGCNMVMGNSEKKKN